MTIEEAIYSLLSADATLGSILGDRIYPLVAPQDATMPLLIYQESNHGRSRALGGATVLRAFGIRLDGYAESYAKAKEIRAAVTDCLLDYDGTISDVVIKDINQEDTSDLHEPPVHADERGYFVCGLDLTVYYTGGDS